MKENADIKNKNKANRQKERKRRLIKEEQHRRQSTRSKNCRRE